MENQAKIDALMAVASDTESDFLNDYSGRGMYGKRCVGIVTDYPQQVMERSIAKGIFGSRMDDMGKQTIVYWPDVQAETEVA